MKKIIAAVAVATLYAGTAAADLNFGVKAGQGGYDGSDSDATQVGVVATMDLFGIVGLEGDLNTSMVKGDDNVFPFGPVEYKMTQAGVYGVVMSPGPFYIKGKAGYAYTNVDLGVGDDSTVDMSYGIGVGFELIGFVWEVEYTKTKAEFVFTGEADVDVVSVSFKF